MKCLECNKEISDGAKFCQYCGTKITAAVKTKRDILDLRLGAKEIAAYFSHENCDGYDSYSSVNVPEGVFAYAFTKNGNVEIRTGLNEFSKIQGQGGIIGGLKKIISSEANPPLAIVKKAVFPLAFNFTNLELKSAFFNLDSQVLCRIKDGKQFLESFLSGSSSVETTVIEENLGNLVKKIFTDTLYEKSAEEILKGKSIENEVFNSLKEKFKEVYPFIEVIELSLFEARNENLSSIKKASENLETEARQSELEKQRQTAEFESFKSNNQLQQEYKKIEQENAVSDIERQNEIEKSELTNRIEKQKIQDSYDDERFSKKIQQDKEEMLSQMELLKEALKIRNARKDADTEREMLVREQENNFELEKLRIQNDEKIRLLQEEARLKDAESKSKDEKAQLLKEHNSDFKNIVSAQIKSLGEKNDW